MEKISKYCYDNGVLKNKFDICDIKQLHKVERDITTYRISQLECGDFSCDDFFKVDSYLKIRLFLFSDIYPFAGEFRDETIYKSNEPFFHDKTIFAAPYLLYSILDYCLKEMKNNVRKIKSRDDLLQYLSYYYGEINMIHPFREGNGRTLRVYMELLVKYLNAFLPFDDVEIHYSLWNEEDREKLLRSTIISNRSGDVSGIRECYDKILVAKDIDKKKSRL